MKINGQTLYDNSGTEYQYISWTEHWTESYVELTPNDHNAVLLIQHRNIKVVHVRYLSQLLLTGDASSEFAAIAKLNNWSASFKHLVNKIAYGRLLLL